MMSYTAFQVFAIGYGHASGYDLVGVTWFSIPLISGLGTLTSTKHHRYDGEKEVAHRVFSWFFSTSVLRLQVEHFVALMACGICCPCGNYKIISLNLNFYADSRAPIIASNCSFRRCHCHSNDFQAGGILQQTFW